MYIGLLDLSKCNYCTLKGLEERAEADGANLATKTERGGITVYVGGNRICWMARVPDECKCEDAPAVSPDIGQHSEGRY